jgi:hypothetical protein
LRQYTIRFSGDETDKRADVNSRSPKKAVRSITNPPSLAFSCPVIFSNSVAETWRGVISASRLPDTILWYFSEEKITKLCCCSLKPKRDWIRRAPFGLSEQQHNLVIFSSEKYHKIVSGSLLAEMTPRQVSATELENITGQENAREGGFVMERTAFLGERLFTSALLSVSSPENLMVYCLNGHGEHSITNLSSTGFGECGQLLGEMNLRVRDLALQQQSFVFDLCGLLWWLLAALFVLLCFMSLCAATYVATLVATSINALFC